MSSNVFKDAFIVASGVSGRDSIVDRMLIVGNVIDLDRDIVGGVIGSISIQGNGRFIDTSTLEVNVENNVYSKSTHMSIFLFLLQTTHTFYLLELRGV